VLSYEERKIALPDALSKGEREVAEALLHGKSNREIANARGTAVRTVANQVASVFRRCGVASRAELIAKLRG
jgi:DNA-binding NarL/FixJ family response regulator